MSSNRPAAAPQCDDDVAGLFMKLGDGKGRPEYREFPEARLPAAATRPAAPAAVAAPDLPAAQADTPLSQLFRRLAEAGGTIPDDSPLIRLRRQ